MGSVFISNAGALGADSSQIQINGNATRGLQLGGQLVLEGGYTSGVNMARGVKVQGSGPVGNSGAALVGVRSNTISGPIALNDLLGATAQSSTIASVGGMLTMTGKVNVAGTSGTTFASFGATNGVGAGSYLLSGGTLAGTGSLLKQGGGTLILSPADASGFLGSIRHTAGFGPCLVGQCLGCEHGDNHNGPVDLNGGILEVRTDAWTPTATARNIYHRAGGGSAIFVDHAIGSAAQNQLVNLGDFRFEPNFNV